MSTFVTVCRSLLLIAALVAVSRPAFAGGHASNTGIPAWVREARIAGVELHSGMSSEEVAAILDGFVRQNVSVVEADSDFSLYLTEERFVGELQFIKRFVEAAHRRGLRVVSYHPVLEVLTEKAKDRGSSMYQDHPDWVQRGQRGEPSVFIGGQGRLHWVEKDMESAWMTIQSPYANYFIERVRRLAETGVDGLWFDVPLLSDINTDWPDTNPYAAAKFKADTGFDTPTKDDWDDPVWRRWIAWRYQETTKFLERIAAEVRKSAPESAIIVENVTIDNSTATKLALDGSTIKRLRGIIQVWEIDVVSDKRAMEQARYDDWISFVAMNKFAKSASGEKPSWVFSYGYQPKDAEIAMAIALASGNHPYETKVPVMSDTVGEDFRTRAFSRIKSSGAELFKSQSAAPVGVLFSSVSRDYTDRAKGSGLFATWQSKDPLWWTNNKDDSIYSQTYMAEYRGIVKLLSRTHVPFDIVVAPDDQELDRYPVLIAPALNALSDADLQRLRRYVERGGKLSLTGPSPLSQNEFGDRRPQSALVEFGLADGKSASGRKTAAVGKGAAIHIPKYVGKSYFTGGAETGTKLTQALLQGIDLPIQVSGEPRVHIELRKYGSTTLVHLVNIPHSGGTSGLQPATLTMDLRLAEASCQPRLIRTGLSGNLSDVDFSRTANGIRFSVRVETYAMLRLLCSRDETPPSNSSPVAHEDILRTIVGQPLIITPEMLTHNDGDIDGDRLQVRAIGPERGMVGTIVQMADGNWRYTPAEKFLGVENLVYEIDDGKGGRDKAKLRVEVGPETLVFYPTRVLVSIGKGDGGPPTSLHRVDNKTLDIRAELDGKQMVADWIAHTFVGKLHEAVKELHFEYAGQFSCDDVFQTISIYNHKTKNWDMVDNRVVGTGDEVTVNVVLVSDPQKYVSADGDISVRFRAQRSNENFTQWANAISWSVVKKH